MESEPSHHHGNEYFTVLPSEQQQVVSGNGRLDLKMQTSNGSHAPTPLEQAHNSQQLFSLFCLWSHVRLVLFKTIRWVTTGTRCGNKASGSLDGRLRIPLT